MPGALAATDGVAVSFRESDPGPLVVAHEALHLHQRRLGPNGASPRAAEQEAMLLAPSVAAGDPERVSCGIGPGVWTFKPEDAAMEMIGRQFSMARDVTIAGVSLKAGELVTISAWTNAARDVEATVQREETMVVPHLWGLYTTEEVHVVPKVIRIPKTLLRPVGTPGDGITDLTMDSKGVAKRVEAKEKEQAAWEGRRTEYEAANNLGAWQKERDRFVKEQTTRWALLNETLIQETMYNRFDPLIQKWTTYYNGVEPFRSLGDPLDPNLVKALMFEETKLGTSGRHLGDADPRKGRHNLLQAVDSSSQQLMIMMIETGFKDEAWKKGVLSRYDADRERYKVLTEAPRRTEAERLEMERLGALQSNDNWEGWFWADRTFREAAYVFLNQSTSAGGPKRSEDYDFWIRNGIRWLYEKRTKTLTWKEATKAFNGTGEKADHYRDRVWAFYQRALKASGEMKP